MEYKSLIRWFNIIIIRADILLIACIFPHPYRARKNNMQLAKYLCILYVKPSNKVYLFKVKVLSGKVRGLKLIIDIYCFREFGSLKMYVQQTTHSTLK